MGQKKQLPVLIIPGIMSSGLEVVKSRNSDSYVGQRVWMNPTAIGFGAMYRGRAEETVLNEKNPRNLLKQKTGRFDALSEAFDEEESDEEEEELYDPPKGVSKEQVKEAIKCKSAWLDHLSLSNDMVNERNGNEIRPIAGLDGVDFLTDLATIKVGASYVFGPIIALLESKGYTRQKDLDAAPYDWRIPPALLEERDGYFTKTCDRIEKMYQDSGHQPVVLLCHSMGCKCGHYLLTFAKKQRGQAWLDQYVHSYMPVGGPHIGAPATISMAFNPELNPMLDPMLRNEERLIFGRSLGSAPWLMPRTLPGNVSAPPCLFYKEEGLLEITVKEPLGDCDTLIATSYGTRDMDSLKLFVEYGGTEHAVHSKKTPILDTHRTKRKDAKYFQFKQTFQFATPPSLEEGALESFELVLKHAGNARAGDLEKANMAFEALRLLDKDRVMRLAVHAGHRACKVYKTVIGRSTKQTIDVKALSSSAGFEIEMPVTIHARVDMHLWSCEPKANSRQIQTTVCIKWTPPLSASPPTCASAPLGIEENPNGHKPTIQFKSTDSPAAQYKPVSGNTIFQAEGMYTALDLIGSKHYEKDNLGPRTTSAVDAPPVKTFAVYGINLPTQVSAVCSRRPIWRSGPGMGVSSQFILDKSSCLAGNAHGYEMDDGLVLETSATPQHDLLTGKTVHKCGDGTVPYYSLQQCQVWKKEGSHDVQIKEIEGAEHRAILADKRFHDTLLNYVMA